MNKKKLTRLTTLILMGFFLFTSTYSFSNNAESHPRAGYVFEVAKKSNSSLLDLSFLFAESNEKDEETANTPLLISNASGVFYVNTCQSEHVIFYLAPRFFGNSAHTPVYLVKRSLLI